LVFLLLVPAFALAQSAKDSWDNLKQLASGQQIQIVLNDAKSYSGQFQSVSDDGIVLRLGKDSQTFKRQSVLRVSTKGASHRARNALIGAGVGAGVGAAGFGACNYREVIPCGGTGAASGAVILAPVGAVVGVVMPTGGWHDIYRATKR
jgi:hypothetical protein